MGISRRKRNAPSRPTWRPMSPSPSLLLLTSIIILLVSSAPRPSACSLYEDYEQCRDTEQFGRRPNGSLVCDPDGRLQPKAVEQLAAMFADLEQNIPCDCADGGCARTGKNADKGDQFMALLLVANQERVDQSVDGAAGVDGLNETARRVWDDAGMGDERCDNGMLLIYVRDQKRMAVYQGHASQHERFKVFSDKEIANLHELAMNGGGNGTGGVSALPLGDFGASGAADGEQNGGAEVRRADDNWAPILGLSLALALTFLVLVILLALLLAKCCRMCCCRRGANKTSKYYINPMPGYKSIEPIYIVTPASSEVAAFGAPPSHNSLYGTGGPTPYGTHRAPPMLAHHGLYGPPLPPASSGPGPLVHHPRSRSITPTSTQRIHRTYFHHANGAGASGGGGTGTQRTTAIQSIQSTPEANKRDKVNRTMTVHSNGTGTYYSAAGGSSGLADNGGGGSGPRKKLSYPPPPTIHEADSPPSPPPPPPLHHPHPHQQQYHPHHQQHHQPNIVHPRGSATSSSLSQPPPALPFLDPWRKQEVQTREEFIG